MRIAAIGVAALLTVWNYGCGMALPIALDGPPADLGRLVGQWEGRYMGARHSRSGSIAFTLVAGEDHAHGDVLMIPAGAERAYSRYPGRTLEPSAQFSQILTIRFVRASGGSVSGSLDPYWDPDGKCTAYTTFRGSVGDNVMQGTFTSTCDNGLVPAMGRWKVVRRQ
jgi:hypothetical protein